MFDASSLLGATAFLSATSLICYGGALGGIVAEAMRPQRKTVGWALGRGTPIEPDAWGLPARTWIHTFRGAKCPVFDIGDADPAAPTAVVLHGFARSRYDALARLGPLLPFARRFILPDLPGHGDARGRGTRLGADEDCFVSSLLTESTTASLLLVGHSLGATVAIHAATGDALRDRVQGVLALAPYERLRTPLGARLDLRGMPRAPLLGPTIATLALLGIRERSTRAAAEQLRCPLAVIAGECDPVTPIEEAHLIAEAAKRGRFTLLAHGRHDDFHTVGREEMSNACAWLAQQTHTLNA